MIKCPTTSLPSELFKAACDANKIEVDCRMPHEIVYGGVQSIQHTYDPDHVLKLFTVRNVARWQWYRFRLHLYRTFVYDNRSNTVYVNPKE